MSDTIPTRVTVSWKAYAELAAERDALRSEIARLKAERGTDCLVCNGSGNVLDVSTGAGKDCPRCSRSADERDALLAQLSALQGRVEALPFKLPLQCYSSCSPYMIRDKDNQYVGETFTREAATAVVTIINGHQPDVRSLLDSGPPHEDCDCMSCRPWTT